MTTSAARNSIRKPALVHAERAVAAIATGVALSLHVRHLAHVGALWRDEVNTANLIAVPSLADLWRGLEFESFPVLFPILLRGWAGLAGDSDSALRAAGLVGGLSIIAVVWLSSARLRFLPVLSLALLATNPAIVRWGSSVRAFGWAAALALAALVLMALACEQESRSRRRLAVAALVGIASVQCLYQNAILLAAAGSGVGLAALLRRDRRAIATVAAIGLSGAASLIPYIDTLRRVGGWSDVNQSSFSSSFLATRVRDAVAAGGDVSGAIFALLVAAAVAAGVFAAFARSRESDAARRTIAFSGAATAAIVGFAVFVLRLDLPTQPWYYIGVIVFVAFSAEAALASLRSHVLRSLTMVAAVLVLAMGTLPADRALQAPQTNSDAVAAMLEARAVEGDLVVASPWYLVFGIARYFHGPASVVTLPPLEDTSLHRYDLLRRAMQNPDAVSPLLAQIESVLRAGHAVYVAGGVSMPPPGWRAPAIPPPPLPRSGWNNLPYLNAWSAQVGSLLRDRTREGSRITLEAAGGRFEDIRLYVFRGWRE